MEKFVFFRRSHFYFDKRERKRSKRDTNVQNEKANNYFLPTNGKELFGQNIWWFHYETRFFG